MGTEPNC